MTDKKPMDQTPLNLASIDSGQFKDGRKQNGRAQSRWIILICVNICLVMLSHMMYVVYSNAVVRTLERRFALTSSQTGFLQCCNDIIHVCLVIFIGYFSGKSNKPRIMCVTVMFTAFSAFLMSSPHFLLHDYLTLHESKISENNIYHNYTTSSLCRPDETHVDQCLDKSLDNSIDNSLDVEGSSKSGVTYHPAYYIFVIAQLISGVGSSAIFTLSIAYMDENAPKDRASFYIGIVYSMLSFGPLSGILLGAFCLRWPENLTEGLKIDTTSPNFIGCWWLGYLICGIMLTASGLPLWFYPNRIQDDDNSYSKIAVQNVSILQQIKAFPKALKRLFTNRPYVTNLINIVCGAYLITGVFANSVRYVEIHFMQRAFVGAIIAGISSTLSGAVGSFAGGAVMARCRLKIPGALKIMITSNSIITVCLFLMIFITCPQPPFNTYEEPATLQRTVLSSCNANCGCQTSRKAFTPICVANQTSYFSPCVAGCTQFINNTYENCGCISEDPWETATPGLCRKNCFSNLIMWSIVLLLFSFSGSFSRVPATMVSFRIVGDEDKTFALGLNSFIMNLLGFIPAPIVYGFLIDKSCILWEKTCGVTGTCLVYNTDSFRRSVFGFTLAVEALDLCVVVVVLLLVRRSPVLKNLYANAKNQPLSPLILAVPFDEQRPYIDNGNDNDKDNNNNDNNNNDNDNNNNDDKIG